MKNIGENAGLGLLEKLCGIIAPTGCETNVSDYIEELLRETGGVTLTRDSVGNLYALKKGSGKSGLKIMVSAHMDEVGFYISGIDGDGLLSFSACGGITDSVLAGKAVIISDGNGGTISGVISAKPVHLLSAKERESYTPAPDLRIDIGASSGEDAEKYVKIGTAGSFDSDFTFFGDGTMICGRAIDDRIGCAIMCDIINDMKDRETDFDICFAFTTREEIGFSGALHAAEFIRPDLAIVLESTAVSDLAGVPASSKVAIAGNGPTVSFMDRGTIYRDEIFRFVLDTAEKLGIRMQPKRFVSGGNDAKYIHQTNGGTAALNISVPTRYLHSASCVIAKEDFHSAEKLVSALLDSDPKVISDLITEVRK